MAKECEIDPHIRGILKSDLLPNERSIRWFEPSPSLAPFVQRIWWAEWCIPPGEYRCQPVLPHPSANLVLEQSDASIIGIMTSAATQRLEGAGSACGAKFQPGALRAFGIEEPSTLRGKVASASSLLGRPMSASSVGDAEFMAEAIETYLLACNPRQDLLATRARAIAEHAEAARDVVSVSQLAEAFGLSIRSVQDICRRALGVSPKWLIRCFRLQDALERLEIGQDPSLAVLAQELGYFDQSHFTRDFKQVTGISPGRY